MPTKNLTKADEIALLREFVVGLPEVSYLRSALEPFAVEFERDIYSDIVPSVHESWVARLEADAELREAQRKVREVNEEAEKARREAAVAHARLNKLIDLLREVKVSAEVAERSAERVASKLYSSL